MSEASRASDIDDHGSKLRRNCLTRVFAMPTKFDRRSATDVSRKKGTDFAWIWKKWKMRQRPKPFCFLERAMGIEPTSEAWEASILPLYDARSMPYFRHYTQEQVTSYRCIAPGPLFENTRLLRGRAGLVLHAGHSDVST